MCAYLFQQRKLFCQRDRIWRRTLHAPGHLPSFFLILPFTTTPSFLPRCLHPNILLNHSTVQLVALCLILSPCKALLAILTVLATTHTHHPSISINFPLTPQTPQAPTQWPTITVVPSKSPTIQPTAQNCTITIRRVPRLRLQAKTRFLARVVPARITTPRQLADVVYLLSCRWRNNRSQLPRRSWQVLVDEGMRHILFVLSLVVAAPSLVDSTFEAI